MLFPTSVLLFLGQSFLSNGLEESYVKAKPIAETAKMQIKILILFMVILLFN